MSRIALIGLAALLCTLPAAAQYPERPVTMLSGYPPGGMVDIVARLLPDGMKTK